MELDVGTRAVLKAWLLPPGILLILLLIGWVFARRAFGRILLFLTIAVFYLLATSFGAGWLASRLETIPATPISALERSGADAILVFLAGVRDDNPELDGRDSLSGSSLERIDFALTLHRQTGLPILLSGGSPKDGTQTLADLGRTWLIRQAGVTPIALDATSRDTRENAANSAILLRERGLERPLLVTHAYHMPRSLFSAKIAGIDAIPAPFAFIHATQTPDTDASDWVPGAHNLAKSYLVLHEMVGLLWYKFTRN